MRYQWTLAAVLSTALIVGCSDRTAENTPNTEDTTGAAVANGTASEPAPAPPAASPRADGSPINDNRPSSGATRTPSTSRPVAPAPARPAGAATSGSTADAPRVQFRDLTLPAGTALPLELLTALSSETAQIEAPVRARLQQAVSVDGYTVLPAGAIVHGNVTAVDRAGRVQGRSQLAFRFTEVEVSGGREELRTNALAFEGEATRGEDATKIGAGAVGGAIIGGILGGGDGAAKGAVIGGAAGSGVVLATRGKDVTLASGTTLAASLAEPMTIRVRN